jgi:hypothetical protein
LGKRAVAYPKRGAYDVVVTKATGASAYRPWGKDSSSLITGMPWQRRVHIGLHFENDYVGSAGCVVLLQDTAIQLLKGKALFEFLAELATQYDVIEFSVI